jgi:DNA-binding transcriptional ArsR family regulator
MRRTGGDTSRRRRAPAVLDATFAALADPTRRQVVQVLRRGPCRAGELARAVGQRPPALSRHLRVLREGGLVEEERGEDARVRVLHLRPAPFAALRAWLDDVEAFWTGQLAAFREHAERTRGRGT